MNISEYNYKNEKKKKTFRKEIPKELNFQKGDSKRIKENLHSHLLHLQHHLKKQPLQITHLKLSQNSPAQQANFTAKS